MLGIEPKSAVVRASYSTIELHIIELKFTAPEADKLQCTYLNSYNSLFLLVSNIK